MSYNGSGTFNINTAGQPVVDGTVISSSVFNALTADLGTGLSTAITKDGQTTPTANIPLGTFKITGLGAGTAATDAVRMSQLQAGGTTFLTAAGTDTITATASPALTAYATGNLFTFVVAVTNTGAVTLNIDGLGAKAVTRDGTTALAANDLVATEVVIVGYDGTRFQVLNPNAATNYRVSGTLGVTGAATLSSTLAVTGAATFAADSAFNSTGAVQISSGNTAARPTGAAGKFRFNTTTSEFEGYNGTAWASVGGAVNLTGPITSVGAATAIASQTGTGSTFVMSASPTLTAPTVTGDLTASGVVGTAATGALIAPSGTTTQRPASLSTGMIRFNTTSNATEVYTGSVWTTLIGTSVNATQKAIFGYGDTGSVSSLTNLVSNTGVVGTDVTGVGTARNALAAAGYGGDKAIFGYGYTGSAVSMTNLVSNTGVVGTDVTGVGTARYQPAAAGYGGDKAIFGYGDTGSNSSLTNLVSNTGVVGADVTGVGTARRSLAAAGYGGDKAIFGYGYTSTQVSMTNLVSNTGVVGTDVTGVGTARNALAAAGYGGDKAIFGYGYASAAVSLTNLVSNTGVVGSDVTGVGTARYTLAAAGYGGDKAIFGYGYTSTQVSMTNLVSNTGVVGTDVTGVGTARNALAAAGYAF